MAIVRTSYYSCNNAYRSRRASWNRTSDLANVPSPWRSPPSSRRRRPDYVAQDLLDAAGGSRRGRDSRSDYARARSIKVVRLGDNARFVLLARSGRTLLAHQDEGFRERGVSVSLGFDPRSLWQNVADFAVGDLERFEIRELHANPRRSRGWSRTVRRGKHNMKSRTAYLTFNLPARIAFENITSKVEAVVRQSGVTEGLVLCNAMHRSRPARPLSRARPHGSVSRRGRCVGGRDPRWLRPAWLADAPPWR